MTEVTQDQAIIELERRLAAIGDAEVEMAVIGQKIKAFADRFKEQLDTLSATKDISADEILEIFEQHRAFLTNNGTAKTLSLRSGTISARLGNEALRVHDETALEKFLRKHGWWLRSTTLPKRTIDKDKVKKNKSLLAQLPADVAEVVRDEKLSIKTARLRLETKRDLHPLRRTLKSS